MKTTLYCVLLMMISFPYIISSQVSIAKTLVENQVNPIGIDEKQPHFSWQLKSEQKGVIQESYEIRLSSNKMELEKGIKLLWTSKQDKNNTSVFIPYEGPALQSNTRYYWQVKITDNKGNTSPWSETAFFHTGLYTSNDWKAKWITSGLAADSVNGISPLLRKSYTIKKKIQTANAFITAKGLYTAYINGIKIGNDLLTPGWTSYNKRIQYQTYDVTNMLTQKENIISAQLGSGWFRTYLGWRANKNIYGKDIALLLQINIKYTDGTEELITSDESWKSSEGPIRSSEIYDGEVYDARLEKLNWKTVGYNDASWSSVKILPKDNAQIISTYNEPIRKRESIKPIAIIKTPKGETVIDFGQNLVGRVRIKGKARSGEILQWKHFEVLDKAGNVYMANMREAKVNASYTFSGAMNEEYAAYFTFYGYRYIWIEKGVELLPNVTFESEAIYSDMAMTGTFECSDSLLNQLQKNIQWGQRGNFLDVPTDCPQRDERLGWTGDAQAFARTAGYNFHVHNFFKKWMKDVALDQMDNGAIPWVIPDIFKGINGGAAGWADVATIIPWDIYLMYGDKRILKDQYPSMKKWVEFMRSKSKNNLWNTGFHFGDWLFFSKDDDNSGVSAVTDKYLIAQSFYIHSTQLLKNAAEVLEYKQDVMSYSALLTDIKKAYLEEYVTPSGRLMANTQTAYVLALYFDLLPEDKRAKAAEYLVENINRYGHLTTGFLGTPYLTTVLTKLGYNDLAYKLLLRKTYPSWLYPVTKGATTIWERWNGIETNGDFQKESMNSFNHYAYGAIGNWIYQHITGIQIDKSHPGYKKFIIHPRPGGDLKNAYATLDTYYGQIKSGWKANGNEITLNIEVPVNTSAILNVPNAAKNIQLNGLSVEKCIECRLVSSKDQPLMSVEIGSGTYTVKYEND
jgi:alpha-L-rhamnosidase